MVACNLEDQMPKKNHRHELIMGRFAYSAEVASRADVNSKAPKLDPMSTNLAERLAAKATDGRAAKHGINVTGLSDDELRKVLKSFPVIPD